MYDLVIGNFECSKLPDVTHFSANVGTKKQSMKDRRECRRSIH